MHQVLSGGEEHSLVGVFADEASLPPTPARRSAADGLGEPWRVVGRVLPARATASSSRSTEWCRTPPAGTTSPADRHPDRQLSRIVREPSGQHHNRSGANLKVPGSGGNVGEARPGSGGQTRAGGSPVGEPPALRCVRGSALDLARLEAGGAHVEPLRGHTGVADEGLDALDVRVPATLGAAVRVRDAVPETGSLAADVAVGSHGESPRSGVRWSSAARKGRRATGQA